VELILKSLYRKDNNRRELLLYSYTGKI